MFYGQSLFGRCYHGYFIGYILEYCLLVYEQLDYGHSAGFHLGQVVATCKMYIIPDDHITCGPYKSYSIRVLRHVDYVQLIELKLIQTPVLHCMLEY